MEGEPEKQENINLKRVIESQYKEPNREAISFEQIPPRKAYEEINPPKAVYFPTINRNIKQKSNLGKVVSLLSIGILFSDFINFYESSLFSTSGDFRKMYDGATKINITEIPI